MIRALVKDPVKRGQAVGFVLGFAVCFLVRPVPSQSVRGLGFGV